MAEIYLKHTVYYLSSQCTDFLLYFCGFYSSKISCAVISLLFSFMYVGYVLRGSGALLSTEFYLWCWGCLCAFAIKLCLCTSSILIQIVITKTVPYSYSYLKIPVIKITSMDLIGTSTSVNGDQLSNPAICVKVKEIINQQN